MTEKGWKKVERRIAEYFGTTRNPLSGGNSRHSRSDSLHPSIFIEVKHGSGCPQTWDKVTELFGETEILALRENKVPLLVLHRKRGADVAQYDAYLKLEGASADVLVCVPLRIARDMLLGGSSEGSSTPPIVSPTG